MNSPLVLNGKAGQQVCIKQHGILNIKSLCQIDSDNGFDVGFGGILSIDCDESITLENDIVRAGGNMNIKAKKIMLEDGFTVEDGGTFKFSTN